MTGWRSGASWQRKTSYARPAAGALVLAGGAVWPGRTVRLVLAEHLDPDLRQRVGQDVADITEGALADVARLPGRRAQLGSELDGHPLDVGERVLPALARSLGAVCLAGIGGIGGIIRPGAPRR